MSVCSGGSASLDIASSVVTVSTRDAVTDSSTPIRLYHLAIVAVFSFGLGATLVWLLFFRLGALFTSAAGGSSSGSADTRSAALKAAAGSDLAAPRRPVVSVTDKGRLSLLSRYHFPLPVYPRNGAHTSAHNTASESDKTPAAPPIDVRQYFHQPNS